MVGYPFIEYLLWLCHNSLLLYISLFFFPLIGLFYFLYFLYFFLSPIIIYFLSFIWITNFLYAAAFCDTLSDSTSIFRGKKIIEGGEREGKELTSRTRIKALISKSIKQGSSWLFFQSSLFVNVHRIIFISWTFI